MFHSPRSPRPHTARSRLQHESPRNNGMDSFNIFPALQQFDRKVWSNMLQPVPCKTVLSPRPELVTFPRRDDWSSQSSHGPPKAALVTAGRPLYIEPSQVKSQSHHPWLSKYVRQQGTWIRPASLDEYTNAQQAHREAAETALAESTKKQVLTPRRSDVKGTGAKDRPKAENEVTQNDWEHRIAEKLQNKPKSHLKQMFSTADSDGSGELDIFEFMEVIAGLGINLPEGVAKIMFSEIDRDKSGTVALDEIIKSCLTPKGVKMTAAHKSKMAALQWEDPKRLFASWDKDGNGSLTANEIRDGLRSYGLPAELATSALSLMDENADDMITAEEWQSEFYKSSLVMHATPDEVNFSDLHGRRSAGGFDMGFGIKIPQVEHRGITINQLLLLRRHIQRRCTPEEWTNHLNQKLNHQTVNLYEIARYVIRPATIAAQVSYIEYIAERKQPPLWFVSHHWGAPVREFITCLEQHCADRSLSREDSPYWVCAYVRATYNNARAFVTNECTRHRCPLTNATAPVVRLQANNLWKLDDPYEHSDDPAVSSFSRVIGLAQGTLAIIDENASMYKRAWCLYEAFVCSTSASQGYLYDTYMNLDEVRGSRAVGLTDGVTQRDGRGSTGLRSKENRESGFPLDAAQKALTILIEKAKSSVEADRARIFNSIIGASLSAKPRPYHEKYHSFNSTISGRLAVTTLPAAISARREMPFLQALKAGILKQLQLNFEGYAAFNMSMAIKLAEHLPQGLLGLSINLNGFGDAFLAAVDFENLKSLTSLSLPKNGITGEGARALVAAFDADFLDSLEVLNLSENLIEDEPMMRLFESTCMRFTLDKINVEENPARAFVLEAMTNQQIFGAAEEYLEHIGPRVSLKKVYSAAANRAS